MHTHVGVGLDYSHRGFRMTQEFIKHYVDLSDDVPREARLGQTILLSGRVLNTKHPPKSVAVFYEPLPCPMTVVELNRTYSYGLPDDVEYEYPVSRPGRFYSDGSTGSLITHADGRFECEVSFKRELRGLYTICLWLKGRGGHDILATHLTIRVRG